MAKSPEQIVALRIQHAQQSKAALEVAVRSSNWGLVGLNTEQFLKASLMQGLVGWRCELSSPLAAFKDGVEGVKRGISILSAVGKGTQDISADTAAIIAFLINEPPPAPVDLQATSADRMLDAVLARALTGEWDGPAWNTGMEQLNRTKGASLACESYDAYHRILHPAVDGDVGAAVGKAIALFAKRRGNSFYRGAEATEGGGDYNGLTVDYRFSAVLKKAGRVDGSFHSWRWG